MQKRRWRVVPVLLVHLVSPAAQQPPLGRRGERERERGREKRRGWDKERHKGRGRKKIEKGRKTVTFIGSPYLISAHYGQPIVVALCVCKRAAVIVHTWVMREDTLDWRWWVFLLKKHVHVHTTETHVHVHVHTFTAGSLGGCGSVSNWEGVWPKWRIWSSRPWTVMGSNILLNQLIKESMNHYSPFSCGDQRQCPGQCCHCMWDGRMCF